MTNTLSWNVTKYGFIFSISLCMYVCMYVRRHSINKVNFGHLEPPNVYRFKEIKSDGSFHVPEDRQNFSLIRESVYFHSMDCLFDSGSQWQSCVLPICKHCLIKSCFYLHIIHSSLFHMVCTSQLPVV